MLTTRDAIESSAKDLGSTGRDDKFGHGLVQLDRAYDALVGYSCEDSPIGWYDSDGPEFNCNYYAQGNNCAVYGDSFENMNKTANQACCVCGGGVKMGIKSESPSVLPTISPSAYPTESLSYSPSSSVNSTMSPSFSRGDFKMSPS